MNLNRNRSTEKDLREYLQKIGYYGRTARFQSLKLKAIERPGWVQVFQFEVEAKRVDGDWECLFGNCRTDERVDLFEVELAANQVEQEDAFVKTAEGMITHSSVREQAPFRGLLFVVVVAVILSASILLWRQA